MLEEMNIYGALDIGDPTRVNENYWKNWSIDDCHSNRSQLLQRSRQAYRSEWNESDSTFHDLIAQAAINAGLADANALMNKQVGEIVANKLMTINRDIVKLLDVGSGNGGTIQAVLSTVSSAERNRLYCTLIEPSARSLQTAIKSVEEMGVPQSHITAIQNDDETALPECTDFDIATGVASLHHHANIESVFALIHQSLKPSGTLVIGDWHNSMSTHPAEILHLLEQTQAASSDIERFVTKHPNARSKVPSDKLANRQIRRFWIEYAKLLNKNPDVPKLITCEGHVPPEDYITFLTASGFDSVSQHNVTHRGEEELDVLRIAVAEK